MALQLAILDTGAHNTAAQYSRLFGIYLVVLAAGGGLVAAAVVLSVLRARRRRQAAREESTWARRTEAGWVIALALVAAGLVGATFRSESGEDALARNPGVRIDVTASQWHWQFAYPDAAAPQRRNTSLLRVPAGTVVEFRLESNDVLHSFWISALRFKRYAYPNFVNRFDLVFRRTGRLQGTCAQFCGLGHDTMRFDVLVMPPARFKAWLAGTA